MKQPSSDSPQHSQKTLFLTCSQLSHSSNMFAFINNFIANRIFPIHYLEFHDATANYQERNILLELAVPYPAVEEQLQNLFNVKREVHQLKQWLEDLQRLSCLMLDDLCEEGFDHLTRNFWESWRTYQQELADNNVTPNPYPIGHPLNPITIEFPEHITPRPPIHVSNHSTPETTPDLNDIQTPDRFRPLNIITEEGEVEEVINLEYLAQPAIISRSSSISPAPTLVASSSHYIAQFIDNLITSLGEIVTTRQTPIPRPRAPRPPTLATNIEEVQWRDRFTQRGTPTCYHCHRPGHLQWNCPTRLTQPRPWPRPL